SRERAHRSDVEATEGWQSCDGSVPSVLIGMVILRAKVRRQRRPRCGVELLCPPLLRVRLPKGVDARVPYPNELGELADFLEHVGKRNVDRASGEGRARRAILDGERSFRRFEQHSVSERLAIPNREEVE